MKIPFQNRQFDHPSLWEAAEQEALVEERMHLAASWLPGEVYSVLDVGCGSGQFLNQMKNHHWTVGTDRSFAALERVRSAKLQAEASGLPFSGQSFDAVVSMEMLEHVPDALYAAAVEELARTSRGYILITVPYCENLSHSQIACPRCQTTFHLYHHQRSFSRSEVEGLFAQNPRIRFMRCQGICPAETYAFPGIWNAIRTFLHRGGRRYPVNTVCPACGYLKDSKQSAGTGGSSKPASSRKFKISQMWPKRINFTWWLALYQVETQI